QYFDKETKLHYNYFRSYDSRTGRYTQGDPIGLDGGWNRFGYVGGDPLRYSDPKGLQVAPTPVGPVPIIIPPGSGNISYPPPDFDPWRDGRPEVPVPVLDPRIPRGPRPPNDPDGNGACRRMYESCMTAATHRACPAPFKPPAIALCTAALILCVGTLGD
ncbi:MAG: RHS repeat-associated core domain-containing protein, partial [Acidovorax sp.]